MRKARRRNGFDKLIGLAVVRPSSRHGGTWRVIAKYVFIPEARGKRSHTYRLRIAPKSRCAPLSRNGAITIAAAFAEEKGWGKPVHVFDNGKFSF